MRKVFADANYWIAMANATDQWHDQAKQITVELRQVQFVTTEEVLTEFLNFYSEKGPSLRKAAARMVRSLNANPNVMVLPQTRDSFLAGLDLYERRADKGFSLTDCISMVQMREHGIVEILTSDHHFRQEGFSPLLDGLAQDK
ncbi:MAG: type II toxin-antitoxin system VapC family toxin [Isosphaerales bacterium]